MSLLNQSLRYLLVGAVVLSADVGFFALVVGAWPQAYLPANVGAKAVGAVVGFLLHGWFTFNWKKKYPAARRGVAYLAVLVSNMVLSTALLFLAVDLIGMVELLAKALVELLVVIFAFTANRLVVFAEAR